jgi:hypothetical protein
MPPRLHAVWNRDDETKQLTKLTVFEAPCVDTPGELRVARCGGLMALAVYGARDDSQPRIILLDKAGFDSLCERAEEFRRQWSAEVPA